MNIPDHLLRSNHHFDIDYRLLCDIEQESKEILFSRNYTLSNNESELR